MSTTVDIDEALLNDFLFLISDWQEEAKINNLQMYAVLKATCGMVEQEYGINYLPQGGGLWMQ